MQSSSHALRASRPPLFLNVTWDNNILIIKATGVWNNRYWLGNLVCLQVFLSWESLIQNLRLFWSQPFLLQTISASRGLWVRVCCFMLDSMRRFQDYGFMILPFGMLPRRGRLRVCFFNACMMSCYNIVYSNLNLGGQLPRYIRTLDSPTPQNATDTSTHFIHSIETRYALRGQY